MKTKVPIRFIEDHSADEIIDQVWGKDTKTEPLQQFEKEKVISYTADIKTYTIALLSIILIAILVGYYMADRRISAEYENIQEQNKNITVQTRIMNTASGSITKSILSREKSYDKIKTILNEK